MLMYFILLRMAELGALKRQVSLIGHIFGSLIKSVDFNPSALPVFVREKLRGPGLSASFHKIDSSPVICICALSELRTLQSY